MLLVFSREQNTHAGRPIMHKEERHQKMLTAVFLLLVMAGTQGASRARRFPG
jgi:hypothetical protein